MTTLQADDAVKISFLAHEMGQWIDRVLGPEFHRYHARHAWTPCVNLYEDGEAYCLVADMAGIEPDAIDLRLEERQLTLRGERQAPRPSADKCCPERGKGAMRIHLMEIDCGPFARTLNLPQSVDTDRIEAWYRHGLLWVKMPKIQPQPPRGRRKE